jgi:hypothetical protein
MEANVLFALYEIQMKKDAKNKKNIVKKGWGASSYQESATQYDLQKRKRQQITKKNKKMKDAQ